MKKSYTKLESELLLVESEGGFMECSVRVNAAIQVEDYKQYNFGTVEDPNYGFAIGFDE